MTLTHFAIIAVCAYLLGSLSFAIIVSKVTLGKDIALTAAATPV